MINFAMLQALDIPEGKVVEIKDAAGRVIWAVQNSKPVILQVAKVTSDTYAGETTYTGEQFILLDIYPKTNGTVKVTYGGLTKTITDTSGVAEPNAQQVFFGTFNGVSDSVATPASGELTIEGGFYAFGSGSFQNGSKAGNIGYCSCITAFTDWGSISKIPNSAFRKNSVLVLQELPEGIESIGDYAFAMNATSTSVAGSSHYNLTWATAMEGGTLALPSTIKSIGKYAFVVPAGVLSSSGGSTNFPCYLAKVKILATTPPTLGECAFGNSGSFRNNVNFRVETFEVPKGCGAAYKAAEGWSAYANYIVEAS